jgi:hypothetical protein
MSEPDTGNFEPYFTAIGKVANAYSQMEFSVNDAIWELANISRSAGVCMTAQMIGPGPRNRCLLALLKFRQAPLTMLDDFNVISRKMEKVAAKRNRYVHDPIVMETETGEISRMEATADKHIRYGFVAAEVADLIALIIEIDNVGHEFDKLYLRARDELPAWPRTQFERSEGIQVNRTGQKTVAMLPTQS